MSTQNTTIIIFGIVQNRWIAEISTFSVNSLQKLLQSLKEVKEMLLHASRSVFVKFLFDSKIILPKCLLPSSSIVKHPSIRIINSLYFFVMYALETIPPNGQFLSPNCFTGQRFVHLYWIIVWSKWKEMEIFFLLYPRTLNFGTVYFKSQIAKVRKRVSK